MTFSVNQTFGAADTTDYMYQAQPDGVLWAPNRQVLDSLNEDFGTISFMSMDVDRDVQPDTGMHDTDTFDSNAMYNRGL